MRSFSAGTPVPPENSVGLMAQRLTSFGRMKRPAYDACLFWRWGSWHMGVFQILAMLFRAFFAYPTNLARAARTAAFIGLRRLRPHPLRQSRNAAHNPRIAPFRRSLHIGRPIGPLPLPKRQRTSSAESWDLQLLTSSPLALSWRRFCTLYVGGRCPTGGCCGRRTYGGGLRGSQGSGYVPPRAVLFA
jgi:hypothetical protein